MCSYIAKSLCEGKKLANEEQSTFDVEFALNQFSGNRALLVKMLDRFCEQYASFTKKLLSYASTSDDTLAKQDVHGLKGVSGNLGMKALHQSCREFEDVLRQHKISAADNSSLINALNVTLQQVRQYISSNDEAPAAQEVPSNAVHDIDANARQALIKA